MNLVELLTSALEDTSDIFGAPGSDAPVGYRLAPASPMLCLTLGDNASGKSLIRRLLTETAHRSEPKIEAIHLSMSGRCESGIPSLMIYGSEGDTSTGHNSASTIEGAFRTSHKREKPHIIIFDEPDIGFSDRWARAAGREICEFIRKAPQNLVGVMLTTHRRAMVEEMLPLDPSALLVGHGWPATMGDWLAGDPRPLEPLEKLRLEGLERYRRICDLLKTRKETK